LKRTIIVTLSVASLAMAWPDTASAQPRRGRVAGRVVVARPYVYRPLWYGAYFNPYWDPWFGPGWGWGGWGGGWGGWGYPYPYTYRLGPAEASVRVDVKPRDAQVYVDGYYAGIVDDFDGKLQRLHVRPGQHEIVIYKEGYRSVRERLYLSVNGSRKITHDLVPLAAGEANEPLPQPSPDARDEEDGEFQAAPPRGPDRQFPQPRDRVRRAPRSSSTGTVSIRVQPADAEILIDGERWSAGDSVERLVVQLGEGPHRIEVERPGYRSASLDVDVRPGETTPVNIALSRD